MAKWFKPKTYGYGATPVTWQGWTIVAGFVTAVLLLVWWLIGFGRSNPPRDLTLFILLAIVALLAFAVSIISKRTTDGEWRWRWGKNS